MAKIWIKALVCSVCLVGGLYGVSNTFLTTLAFPNPSVLPLERASGWEIEPVISNHYWNVGSVSESNNLRLDYELQGIKLGYSRVTTWGRWGVYTDYYALNGGVLDAFVSNWHQFWGFPNANREFADHNQFENWVKSNGDFLTVLNDPIQGFTDVKLYIQKEWVPSDGARLGVVALVALPTGNEFDFLGTGHVLYGGGVRYSRGNIRFPWHVNGVVWSPKTGPYFSGLPTQVPYQVDMGIGIPFFKWSTTHIVSLYQAPYRNTGLSEIEDLAMVYYGLITLHYTESYALDAFIQEDLNVKGAPDFTLGLRVRAGTN